MINNMISMNIKSRKHWPIALDIGHNSVKMIQLCGSPGALGITAAGKVHIDINNNPEGNENSEIIISAIRKLLAKGAFRGYEVISSLPNEYLKITNLRLRQKETEGIDEAITQEAASRFNLKPGIDKFDFKYAGTVRQGNETVNEYILFGTANDSLKNHILILEKCGLKPVGIDPVPCALFRCFERFMRRQEDKEQTEVLIDVGSRTTTVVFGRDGDIGFVKNIPIGTFHMSQEIASRLGISANEAKMLRRRLLRKYETNPLSNSNDNESEPDNIDSKDNLDPSTRQTMVDAIDLIAENIAKEISLCFRYYTVTFRGKRAQKATISGGGAYERILLNVLRRYLAVDIILAQPLSGIDISSENFGFEKRDFNSEWAVPVGLGLKSCQHINRARLALRN